MKAMKSSPEFIKRLKVIENNELQAEGGEVPQFVEDDEDTEHLIEDDAVDSDHPVNVILALQAAGVSRPDAVRKVSGMTTFHEVYGRGFIVETANHARRDLNVKGLRVLDMRVLRPDGEKWDFTKAAHRREARELIAREDPDWIICGPPCTAFSNLNYGLNYPKLPPDEVDRRVAAGMVHLRFACHLYRDQVRRGKFFLHEHPNCEVLGDHGGEEGYEA